MNKFDLSSSALASMLCDGVMKGLHDDIKARLQAVANTVVEDAAREIGKNLKVMLMTARTEVDGTLHVTLKINDKNVSLDAKP